MENFDYSNFYSGGFFLLRSNRPDWPTPFGEFLPDGNLISLASCICPQRLNVAWGWKPGDREAAINFGIPEDRIDEFVEWCRMAFPHTIDLWSVFQSLDSARDFVKNFDLPRENLFLIEVALPKALHKEWLKETDVYGGVAKLINKSIAPGSSGIVLGYEVVSYFEDSSFYHSWLCNGLEHDMHELFGIHANEHGLLSTYADAQQVYEWIAVNPASRAEPGPYDFWAILSYPLSI